MLRDPAFEVAAVKLGAAGAVDLQILRDPLLQPGRGHDDLEGGTGRQLRLNRLVQQRMVFIVDQLAPLIARNPHREIVGIEGRPAHHRQDFSGARVHGDDGAVFPFQRFFRRDLQIDVDRELQLFSRDRIRFSQQSHFAAMAVHQRPPRSVRPHQYVVVLPLHA